MSTSSPQQRTAAIAVPWSLAALGLMWLQLGASVAPVWKDGQYYDYGWFVLPIAAYFFWRRWRSLPALPPPTTWPVVTLIGGLMLLFLFLCLRLGAHEFPGWRLPFWVHAGVVVAVHHGLLAGLAGGSVSLGLAPVTLFALSAVPYPMRVEGPLSHGLAGIVLSVASETFLFLGLPVSVVGEKLSMDGREVMITEGCSGLRSFQSLLMAGLFFGELLWLSWPRRLVLLAIVLPCAVVTNTARAFWLAWTEFKFGNASMDRLHDPAGHAAFILSCAILLAISLALRRQGRTVVSRPAGAAPDPSAE